MPSPQRVALLLIGGFGLSSAISSHLITGGGRISPGGPVVNLVVPGKRPHGGDSGVRGVCRVLRVLFETGECSSGSLPPAAPM
jgi:hypothetical protein